MKTIEFEGKAYEVEDWVEWASFDDDCQIWAFEKKPEIDSNLNGWFNGGRCYYVESVECSTGWQDSLTKV